MKRKNLFLAHTEYHLFILSSLLETYFGDTNDENVILIPEPKNKNRFSLDLNFQSLSGKVVKLPATGHEKEKRNEFVEVFKNVMDDEYSTYVSFHEQSPIHYTILNSLDLKKTKVCLAPEGTVPYISINKLAFPSRLRSTLNNYRFMIKQGVWPKIFRFVGKDHAFMKETDEVWLQYIEKYPNKSEKNVKKIDLFNNEKQINSAKKLFNFEYEDHFKKDYNSNILFFLNHTYAEKRVYDFEIEALKRLLQKFQGSKIYIKLHPNTPAFQIKRYKKLKNIEINDSTIPAELFILSLSDSIVFSFWSASLLIKNPKCNYYWLYPIMQKEVREMDWWEIVNPTSHIHSIRTIDSMKYPS